MAQKFLTGVQLTDGSAGSPALSFSSDTNTGIYRSEDDHVNISVGGTNMFKVTSAGITSSVNVYSGTNGQFRNYAGVWKATTGTSGNGFEFTSADQTGAMTLSSNGNLKVHNNIRSQGHSTTGLSGKGMELRFFTDTDIGSILSYDRSNNAYLPIGVYGSTVSLQTSGTERLHITSAGNVGIGVAPASIGQKLRVNGNIKVGDSQKFLAGAGNDLEIYHDGSNSRIENNTGHLYIRNDANNSDIIFQTDDGTDNVETYFFLDGSAGGTNPITIFPDSSYLKFGDSQDLSIAHTGSYSEISHNGTGHLIIQNTTNDADIIFKSDDGLGGTADYLVIDGSTTTIVPFKDMTFGDSVKATFGVGSDLQIYHDSSNSYIKAGGTGNLYIRQSKDDGDIIFESDDGSGGVATYFFLDGSSVTTQFYKTIKLYDAAQLWVGDGNDLRLYHNGTNSNIENFTGTLQIIQNLDDGDIVFKSDDGLGGTAEYFRLDGSQADGTYRYIDFPDNSVISLGDNDAAIFHDGTDTRIKNETGDLFISQFANDKDIVFRSDDGSGGITEYFRLDGSLGYTVVSKHILLDDNVKLRVGSSADMEIYHNGDSFIVNETGNLKIVNGANDADIIFQCDDGSGGVIDYFKLDGSDGNVKVYKQFGFLDNVKATFGSSGDLQIYHNSAHSFIDGSSGTGSLYIRPGSGNTVQIEDKDGNDMITASPTEVRLLYNNSEKLATTSTGVSITGDLIVSGTTTTVNQTNLDVSDNIIGLNRGASTNTNDSGLIIERGSTGDNAAFLWDESEDKFVFGLTTATPSATGDVALSDYRGIKTGPITASGSITATGNVGIGTTSPGAKLQINGSTSDTSANAFIARNSSGTSLFSIRNDGRVDVPNGAIVHAGGGYANTSTNNSYFTGNVGMGTTSPGNKLHVVESSTNIQALRVDDGTSFVSVVPSLGGGGYTGVSTAGDIGLIFSIDGDSSTDTSNGLLIAPHTQTSGGLKILENGNVGISIASPGHRLHVSSGGSDTVAGFKSTDLRARIAIQDTADISYFGTYNGTTFIGTSDTPSSSNLQITSSGNVGIGTTSPVSSYQLTIEGGSTAGIALSDTGQSGDYQFAANSDLCYWRYDGDNSKAIFLKDSGNVGIGTTAPGKKLEVSGRVRATTDPTFEVYNSSANRGGIQWSTGVSGTNIFAGGNSSAGAVMTFQTNTAERMRITSDGKVGVGTTAPQTNTKLEVSGAIKAGNKTSWSDRDGNPLTTTGRVVAGLTGNANGNGASAMYIFTCYGGNGYQRIVYSCRNQSGTWAVNKDIDEGVDAFDVVASTPSSGSAVTFTFKGRTSSQSYTASVFIEHMGHNLDTQYVG